MTYLQGAHDFSLHSLTVNNSYNSTGSKSALDRLEENIAAGAIHNSAERCDAPKCHPETRTAVQEEILSWISTTPSSGAGAGAVGARRVMWLSGPAGAGKTAIAGSVADMCKEKGSLAASFFFSSFAPSANRRLKRCLVATIAYQLRLYPGIRHISKGMLGAIGDNPAIFHMSLRDQLEALVLGPLREASLRGAEVRVPGVIIVDGVDECEAENSREMAAQSKGEAQQLNEADQIEVLSVLLQAAEDPAFPFTILIASRPERNISSFLDPSVTRRTTHIFLDEKYNPDSDISLFLQSKFSQIRRKYGLAASWPTPEALQTLVSNASGQFIYAATVVRYIQDRSHPPQHQLDRVLDMENRLNADTHPLGTLHALYMHILKLSPDPVRSACWLANAACGMFLCGINDPSNDDENLMPAWFCRQLLEVIHGEAEHILGSMHSLINIPSLQNDRTAPYTPYHRTLQEFLVLSLRHGDLVEQGTVKDMRILYARTFCDAHLRVIVRRSPANSLNTPDLDLFIGQFLTLDLSNIISAWQWAVFDKDCNIRTITPADMVWWVAGISAVDSHGYMLFGHIFRCVHIRCPSIRCFPVCRAVRTCIVEHCRETGWKLKLKTLYLREWALRLRRSAWRIFGPHERYYTYYYDADLYFKRPGELI